MAATQRTVYELHEKKQLVGHLERAGVDVVRGEGPARSSTRTGSRSVRRAITPSG